MAVKICTERNADPYARCAENEQRFVGAVLGVYERNGYDDSDFYAIVWDAEKGAIADYEYGTTRFPTYHNRAEIDATPEVIEAAEQCLAERLLSHYVAQAKTPDIGRRVRSLAKRGKNVGVEGVVRWMRERRSAYGTWSYGYRLGVQVEGEKGYRFMDADKVEVIDEPDMAELRQRAEAAAKQHSWRTAVWGA